MQGVLTHWFADKNYGFIRSEDCDKIFVHRSQFSPKIRHIFPGMKLSFTLSGTGKNQQAKNVIPAPKPVTLALLPEDVLPASEGTTGNIIRLNDARGFGFIRVESCAAEVFFHVSVFAYRNRRPQIGDKVIFLAEKTAAGWQASRVTLAEDARFLQHHNTIDAELWSPQRPVFIVFLIPGLLWLGWLSLYLPAVFMAEILLSLWTFLLYGRDKTAALAGKKRIPENTLHLCDTCDGWVGGLFARCLFSHKTRKRSFIRRFRLSILLNITAVITIFLMIYPQHFLLP